MANTNSVKVRVQKNGVVVHKHEGANGFHDPSRKHNGATSTSEGHLVDLKLNKQHLAKPEGWDALTEEQQTQYAEALAGKTFWIYPTKSTEGMTTEEEQQLIAEMDAGFKADVVAEAEALLAEVSES